MLARATAPTQRAGTLSMRERTVVGALAGAAPDLDFVMTLFGSVAYLEHHRGVTHSLIAMPLWAWLLAVGFSVLGGRRFGWRAYYGVSLLAIAIHILGDLITSYGTQILAPFSTWAPGINTTFIIDPWLSMLLLAGFLASLYWRPRLAAGLGLAAATALVLLQYTQYRAALELGEEFADSRGAEQARVEAYPQPFSPFNWLIAVSTEEYHYLARANQRRREALPTPTDGAPWFRTIHASYRPVDDLHWQRHPVFGAGDRDALARSAWSQDAFAFYRRFAHLPALYDVYRGEAGECAWFVDLRFDLEGMTPPFRFGMCREERFDDWLPYRLGSGGSPRPVY